MSNSSIWPIDRILSGATTTGQSGLNERVFYIPQRSSITGTSPSDCLMSYSRHTFRSLSYHSGIVANKCFTINNRAISRNAMKHWKYTFDYNQTFVKNHIWTLNNPSSSSSSSLTYTDSTDSFVSLSLSLSLSLSIHLVHHSRYVRSTVSSVHTDTAGSMVARALGK